MRIVRNYNTAMSKSTPVAKIAVPFHDSLGQPQSAVVEYIRTEDFDVLICASSELSGYGGLRKPMIVREAHAIIEAAVNRCAVDYARVVWIEYVLIGYLDEKARCQHKDTYSVVTFRLRKENGSYRVCKSHMTREPMTDDDWLVIGLRPRNVGA